MLKLIAKNDVNDAESVELFKTFNGYAVRYGLQVQSATDVNEALTEYSACIAHALSCSGECDGLGETS